MIPLTRLKKDVQFNGELTKVVDVLKGIAAARFYTLERQLALFERFFRVAADFLAPIDLERVEHPFVHPIGAPTGVILVTSNAGFLGGLNSQVIQAGLHAAGPDARVAVIGERGADALRDARRALTTFPGIEDPSRLALALSVRDYLVDQILSGQCGRFVIAYPKAESFSVQLVMVEPLLPCTEWATRQQGSAVVGMLWESRVEDLVEYVVTQWLGYRLDQIFALSRLAELGARAVHLEGSYQELVRLGKKLRLQYFRARHEIIDRSIREIFAAQLLYRRRSDQASEGAKDGEDAQSVVSTARA